MSLLHESVALVTIDGTTSINMNTYYNDFPVFWDIFQGREE
jgi:hypothetical protein